MAEPHWWKEIQKLYYEEGVPIEELCKMYGRERNTIRYAVDPEYREYQKNLKNEKYKKGLIKPRKKVTPRHRQNMVNNARAEAKESGRNVDEILISWGERPRWQRESSLNPDGGLRVESNE